MMPYLRLPTRLLKLGGLSAALLGLSLPAAALSLPDSVNAGERAAALELLAQGADANERSVDGTTALHWAVYRNDVELVELLLRKGADPNARNDYGATP